MTDSFHSAVADSERVHKWQPIETAPLDGSVILAYWLTEVDGELITGDGCYALTKWRGFEWISTEDENVSFVNPTHWMPLPAAPEAA